MTAPFHFFVSVWMKFFFLFTPFFALSMFLSMTKGCTESARRRLALRIMGAVAVFCFAILFFGDVVFSLFGIGLDAFRVGAGALLFLSAVALVQQKPVKDGLDEEDIAVVPLSMPIIVGPATVGTLLVLGAELSNPLEKWLGFFALLAAIVCVGAILLLGSYLERALGRRGLSVMSKVTGLILSALAAQMILTGVQNFLRVSPETAVPAAPALELRSEPVGPR